MYTGDEPVDPNIVSESTAFKTIKWRALIGFIGLLIAMVVILVGAIVINFGEWLDPTVITRAPDPQGTADFDTWTAQVQELCHEYKSSKDRDVISAAQIRYHQLAKGRSIVGVEGTFHEWKEYRSYGAEMVDFAVGIGDVELLQTISTTARPELAERFYRYFMDRDDHGCIVVTADVVEPTTAMGGAYPTPCYPFYKVEFREIAFCDD